MHVERERSFPRLSCVSRRLRSHLAAHYLLIRCKPFHQIRDQLE